MITLDYSNVLPFIGGEEAVMRMDPQVKAAHDMLHKKNGPGKQTDKDGNVIEGIWAKGVMVSGTGRRAYKDGVYEGDFVNDKREGYGVMDYAKGYRYEGEWKEDKLCGEGKWYPNASKPEFYYEGEFDRGMYNGQGTQKYASGSVYSGQFVDNQRCGLGVMTDKDGNKKEGTWKDDQLWEGFGVEVSKGNRYEGNFREGKKSGFGTMLYAKGNRYEGEWENDHLEGTGRWYPVADDETYFYEGDFHGGMIEGEGTYYYSNGDVYTGHFVKNERSGYGVMDYAKGNRYEGNWENGKRNGDGIAYDQNGAEEYNGPWKDDMRLNDIDRIKAASEG